MITWSLYKNLQSLTWLIAAASLALSAIEPRAQELLISEFLSSNQSGLADEDGEPSDWIEIYNSGPETQSLDGWHLTDDASDLTKWTFPDVQLTPESFLVVFASGKDRTDPEGKLHTTFRLSRTAEYLGLIKPDGISISHNFSPTYPSQLEDVSYGIQIATVRNSLISSDSTPKLFIPLDNNLGRRWTLLTFDDEDWRNAPQPIGYQVEGQEDEGPSPNPEPEPEPDQEFIPVVGDLSIPGDRLEPTSLNSPPGEDVQRVIDNQHGTKYLNFDKLNAGFTITFPQATVVKGLRLTSANDAPDRDPTRFILSGSNTGTQFTEVARGAIPQFPDRFETVEISFVNERDYSSYQLIFPTVRVPNQAVAMQIAEVEFLGLRSNSNTPGKPGEPPAINASQLADVTQPDDRISALSPNSPVGEEEWNAIDDSTSTKYLNFFGPGTGFTVTPSVGPSTIKGLRLTSANDVPGRDPTSFSLSGSQDGVAFETIAEDQIPRFNDRFTSVEVSFENDQPYQVYRIVFPTLRGGPGELMQIGEVEFLGTIGLPPPEISELIATDTRSQMYESHSSAYLRYSFEVTPGAVLALDQLLLRVRYDAGFRAYLNGTPIAQSHSPNGDLHYDSLATGNRPSENITTPEIFQIPLAPELIQEGLNLLAIQVLNDSTSSPNFYFDVELEDQSTKIDTATTGYFDTPSPGSQNSNIALGLASPPTFSVAAGFYDGPLEISLESSTTNSTIHYTTDGSEPTPLNGFAYEDPVTVGETTILRARSFFLDWRPSAVSTATYLFLDDIVTQDRQSALDAGFPASWGSQPGDYGLDARVIGTGGRDRYGGRYTKSIHEDLLSIPTVSLVSDMEDLFGRNGIYSNPTRRGARWERPVSVEWIYPDGRKNFQLNAGIRIQGGAFREFGLTLKKSFRLVFRGRYGPPTLDHPIFGTDAAKSLENIVLRANGNDAWRWGQDRALYIRDAYAMETARAMGMVAPHSTFVHLYLNGQYWGLYNPVERPDAAFSASYHGGDKETWDAINQDSTPDGNRDAWNRLNAILNQGAQNDAVYWRVQGRNVDGEQDPDLENLLDVENMIDYLLLNFYVGNNDWPSRNHWYGRDREGDQGFQFYPWDTETTIGFSSVNENRTSVKDAVAAPYGKIRANDRFRRLFGDRVQRHFFNGGVFYVNSESPDWSPAVPGNNRPAARFAALASEIDQAIVGETARWGDQLSGSPFTKDAHWQRQLDGLLRNYFPKRTQNVLQQLRQAGLYPRVDAPNLSHLEGHYDDALQLTLTGNGGTLFYTTDGSEPEMPVEITEEFESVLVDKQSDHVTIVPTQETPGQRWYAQRTANLDNWIPGSGGIGYDTGADYDPFIDISVGEAMQGNNGSLFVRIPFDVSSEDLATANYLTLKMRYDDGFIVYVNGIEVASRNAPPDPTWNSFATATHDDAAAVIFEEIDISGAISRLRAGDNLLAIHGLNVSVSSSDFLIDAELTLGERSVQSEEISAQPYLGPIPITDLTTIKARTFSGTEWSALTEATFEIGQPQLTISELHYHPSDPTRAEEAAGFDDADDFEFIELANIGNATFRLNDLFFSDGIEFRFSDLRMNRLPKGQSLVLVRNRAAFEMRHETEGIVAGEYTGRFSDAGERIQISDENGDIILDWTYSDEAPWAKEADGSGSSLILKDLYSDPMIPASWNASDQPEGTPGELPAREPLTILNYELLNGELHLPFSAKAGVHYSLQSSITLVDGSWAFELERDPKPTTTPDTFVISIDNSNNTKFFRIQESPPIAP